MGPLGRHGYGGGLPPPQPRRRSGGWEADLVVRSQPTHNNGREGGGSMRILVVCGAGASSTFVAQRVRRAAHERGLPYSAVAGTTGSLVIDLDSADIVLVGPHLAGDREWIESSPPDHGGAVATPPSPDR